jgi:hypothetical protein
MNEHEVREALNRHWAASDANDFDVEHDIYREDALLEYPQSGERIKGRHRSSRDLRARNGLNELAELGLARATRTRSRRQLHYSEKCAAQPHRPVGRRGRRRLHAAS